MGNAKGQMDDGGILVRFDCPTPDCDGIIEDHVEGAVFDISAESAGDGIDSSRTPVVCSKCEKEYVVEVVARPGDTTFAVEGHPDVLVTVLD